MAQELKDYNIMDIEAMDDERLEKSSSGKIFVTRVYIKDEVDAVLAEKDAEIRRLKRALWLARADVAKWKSCYYWYAVSRKHDSRMYDEVERKCRAKAEEYK